MKAFLWTFAAVFAGIYVFSRWTAKKMGAPSSTSYGVYAGPDIDPLTGAQVISGNGAGTVSFASGGVMPGDNMSGTGNDIFGKL